MRAAGLPVVLPHVAVGQVGRAAPFVVSSARFQRFRSDLGLYEPLAP